MNETKNKVEDTTAGKIVHDTFTKVGDGIGKVAEATIDTVLNIGAGAINLVIHPLQVASSKITKAIKSAQEKRATVLAEAETEKQRDIIHDSKPQ